MEKIEEKKDPTIIDLIRNNTILIRNDLRLIKANFIFTVIAVIFLLIWISLRG